MAKFYQVKIIGPNGCEGHWGSPSGTQYITYTQGTGWSWVTDPTGTASRFSSETQAVECAEGIRWNNQRYQIIRRGRRENAPS